MDGEHILHDVQNIIGQIAEVQLARFLVEFLFLHLRAPAVVAVREQVHRQAVPLEHEAVDPVHAARNAALVLADVGLDDLLVGLVLIAEHVALERTVQATHGGGDGVRFGVTPPDVVFSECVAPLVELPFRYIQAGRPEELDILGHGLDTMLQEGRILLQRRLAEGADADYGVGVDFMDCLKDLVQQLHVCHVFGLARRLRRRVVFPAAFVAFAEPEALFAFFERIAVEAQTGDLAHGFKDILPRTGIAEAE